MVVDIKVVERSYEEYRNPVLLGLLGFIVGTLVSILLGVLSPIGLRGLASAFYDFITSPEYWLISLPYFAPISLSAAGLALAYQARFITIGSEGQMMLGMIIAFGLSYYIFSTYSSYVAIPIILVISALGGLLLGLLIGFLRVYLGANETLTSLMLNYLILSIVNFLVAGPWQSGPFTKTELVPYHLRLSDYLSVLLSIFVIIILDYLYSYTKIGVSLVAIGKSRRAAITYGIPFSYTILLVASLSGAVAGLGGSLYMLSEQYQLQSIEQPLGYGYMGILAAWLAGLRPIATIASSFLLSLFYSFSVSLQLFGLSSSFILAVDSVIVLSVVIATVFSRYKLVVRR